MRVDAVFNNVRARIGGGGAASDNKFGWFPGVFTPTILTILGLIMYLREGWVVGNAGLLGALAIILLAHLITICTGLAVSSVATNTRVGAGGAFAIISQSLGLEIGGSIGVPLYLAQGISSAFYVLGFSEAFISMFPPGGAPSMWLVAPIAFALVFLIAYVSAQFAARIQFLIMAIIAVSLVSIALGSFPIAGQAGLIHEPQLIGSFSDQGRGFWGTFAIFFPAVTGIMAGISMSGSLREPRRAIPLGTMLAIFVGLVVYVVLAFWLARVATPEELLADSTIMVRKAAWGPAVLAGMLGATFSSALGSIVAAPRVMQALAGQHLIPLSGLFRRENEKGDPRPATVFTGIIGFVTVFVAVSAGGLDPLAELLSLFFLITYGMLNVVVLIEQALGMVSFRPTFSVPMAVPFIGMIGCIFVMFLINPSFSLVAVVVVIILYLFLSRRKFTLTRNDVRSGLFTTIAEWAAVRAADMPSAPERTWKPTVLVPVQNAASLTGSYRFLYALTYPQGGVNILGIHPPGRAEKLGDLPMMTQAFLRDGIYARSTVLEEDDFANGVRVATQVLRRAFFRPNLLFLHIRPDSDLTELQTLVNRTAAYNMGIVLLSRHPVVELGREQEINVWMSLQREDWQERLRESNIDLAILLAFQLRRNWNGRINLCMAVRDDEERERAERFMAELSTLARLPKSTQQLVIIAPFLEALGAAPRADLHLFGLPADSDLTFVPSITQRLEASCAFVRDSGEESALA